MRAARLTSSVRLAVVASSFLLAMVLAGGRGRDRLTRPLKKHLMRKLARGLPDLPPVSHE
jgi:hypothetical protein